MLPGQIVLNKYTSEGRKKINFETLCRDLYTEYLRQNKITLKDTPHASLFTANHINSVANKSLQIAFDALILSTLYLCRQYPITLITLSPILALIYFMVYAEGNNQRTTVDRILINEMTEQNPLQKFIATQYPLTMNWQEGNTIIELAKWQIKTQDSGTTYHFISDTVDIATLKTALKY